MAFQAFMEIDGIEGASGQKQVTIGSKSADKMFAIHSIVNPLSWSYKGNDGASEGNVLPRPFAVTVELDKQYTQLFDAHIKFKKINTIKLYLLSAGEAGKGEGASNVMTTIKLEKAYIQGITLVKPLVSGSSGVDYVELSFTYEQIWWDKVPYKWGQQKAG